MAGWRDEAIPVEQPAAPSWRSQAIPVQQAAPRMSGPAGGPVPQADAGRTQYNRQTPPIERKVIGTFFDNGVIYQNPDGTLSARNDGMVTSNQDTIRAIMQGQTPADVWQAEIDQARIDQNPIAARANEFVRGTPVLGSRIDEAVGLFSPQARDNMRATTEAMQRLKPGATTALNVAGAITGSVPMALAAAGSVPAAISNAPRWGRALAAAVGGAFTGATEGAIYGSGEGTTPEARRQNAITGARNGAIGGAVLGPAGVYAGDAISAVLTRLGQSDVAQIASGLNISNAAARQLKNAIGSGDIATAEEMLRRAGPDAMLGEAGIPMRAVMDATAQSGGPASQIINDAMGARMATATRQVTGALDNTLGMPRGVQDLVEGIRNANKGARSTAYDAAYATPIDYTAPEAFRLDSLLRRVPSAAIRRAQEIMRTRGEESAQIMATIADDGTVSFTRPPDVRQIHYIMQGLDDIAQGTDGSGTFGRQNTYGASIENLRGQISSTLRELVPEFGVAQNMAADTARQLRATDVGRKLTTTPTPDFAREVGGYTTAERTAARDGVRSYIDDMMARVTRTAGDPNTDTREALAALRAFGSRQNQSNLRVLLGQEAADTLLDQMDRASTAFELRAALAEGSRTAIRTSLQSGVREQANTGFFPALMAGEPVNAGKRLVQAMTGETVEARQLREAGLFEEIATALTQTTGDRARTALRMINLAMRGQPLRDQQARLVADVLTGSAVLQSRPTGTYAIERIQGSQ